MPSDRSGGVFLFESVARDRHRADHALHRHIAQHPRRDVPGRPERAGLADQPERERGRDDVADHRDQPDQAVDAVADVGAGQDEGDVEQLRHRFEPCQPLLAAEIAERIGGAEIEAEFAKAVTERFRRNFPPVLVDDRPARPPAVEIGAGGSSGIGFPAQGNVAVVHGHHIVTQKRHASCVTFRAPRSASGRNGGGSCG